jgi:vesicle coat complex subunit
MLNNVIEANLGCRIPSLIEYVMQPLKNGLVDVSPYVRKTAAISCAKTFSVIPTAIKG